MMGADDDLRWCGRGRAPCRAAEHPESTGDQEPADSYRWNGEGVSTSSEGSEPQQSVRAEVQGLSTGPLLLGPQSSLLSPMVWSGREDLNLRPPAPEAGALNQTALRPD